MEPASGQRHYAEWLARRADMMQRGALRMQHITSVQLGVLWRRLPGSLRLLAS